MEIKYRTKIVRGFTPEGMKFLLNYPDQKAGILKVLLKVPQTQLDKLLGQEHTVHERVRVFPKGWTERREALRNLFPNRKLRISFLCTSKCRRCGGRFNATSPRKRYCSMECEKQARYQTRLERGDFKDGMARTRQRKRQAAYDRAFKREQIRKEKQTHKAKSLYQKVVFGNLNKKEEWRYNKILRLLGGKDEAKGHKKIVVWKDNKLKFAQIPAEDQKIFHNLDSE
ncbi:MAG: hypothetical protein IH964_12770 [Candidatus Dadabacteria bacterium]|nr:hypothetical protein [Candidatus Dadabacteria bacterium]